jgi:hypothetical protein
LTIIGYKILGWATLLATLVALSFGIYTLFHKYIFNSPEVTCAPIHADDARQIGFNALRQSQLTWMQHGYSDFSSFLEEISRCEKCVIISDLKHSKFPNPKNNAWAIDVQFPIRHGRYIVIIFLDQCGKLTEFLEGN